MTSTSPPSLHPWAALCFQIPPTPRIPSPSPLPPPCEPPPWVRTSFVDYFSLFGLLRPASSSLASLFFVYLDPTGQGGLHIPWTTRTVLLLLHPSFPLLSFSVVAFFTCLFPDLTSTLASDSSEPSCTSRNAAPPAPYLLFMAHRRLSFPPSPFSLLLPPPIPSLPPFFSSIS